MLTLLALSSLSTAYGQNFAVPTVVDFSDAFETYPNTTSFSGNGGWVSQYTADRWSRANFGNGYIHANTDDRANTAGWGGNRPQDNALVQTGNTCGPAKNQPCSWSTYQLETDYLTGDNDGIGVVFGWVDARNFWVFAMSQDRIPAANGNDQNLPNGSTYSRLIHVVNGVGVESIDRTNYSGIANIRGHIDVLVDNGSVQVWVDPDDTNVNVFAYTKVFDATPSTGIPAGRIGAYCYEDGQGAGCNFDEFSVRLKDTDNDSLADPYDNCPTVANLNQADLDGDGIGDVCDPDQDGDGITAAGGDCNDRDNTIHPGATEICDGIDQDCNGLIDDGAAGSKSYYADTDGDKYGDPNATTTSCVAPSGYVLDKTDCNDKNAAAHPGATEVCDGVDNDCNGTIDDNATDAKTYYADSDGDTYGNPSSATKACAQPGGTVTNNTDCLDTNNSVHPGATEVCNGIDDNCDGQVDNNAVGAPTWYADTDADGYGNGSVTKVQCAQPTGYVADKTDCLDSNKAVHPGATEVCNGIDDDCVGGIDNNAIDAKAWYQDSDGDGHGNLAVTTTACAAPSGYVGSSDDCLDTNKTAYPGATEVCDGVDNDCNTKIDDNPANGTVYYADSDADTYGDKNTSTKACAQPAGYVVNSSDCVDTNAQINPAGTEICNGLDDNCDGIIDNGATDVHAYYADSDGDGFGDPTRFATACTPPAGYVPDKTDCNDTAAAINPSAVELCDGVDNNCNGLIDDNATDALTWYADADHDGLGDASAPVIACQQPAGTVGTAGDCNDNDPNVRGPITWYTDADNDGFGVATATVEACVQPAGTAAVSGDCNDSDRNVSPTASERCATRGVDDNCDGNADESTALDASTWYADGDADGYGVDGTTQTACTAPSGYQAYGGDCDDTSILFHPGAAETCTDTVDYNCDGSIGAADHDGDGVIACQDCDDSDPTAFPGAPEVCDGVDNDCDGFIDGPASLDATTWYADADGDQFGTSAVTAVDCTAPLGFVDVSTDCDDTNDTIYPGAPETCTDTVDMNCDGAFGNTDGDGDGYVACLDCDDTNPDVHPGAVEVCNDIDDNCVGGIDESSGAERFYDDDGDGYGGASAGSSCPLPDDGVLVEISGDCDDNDSAINPGATEIANDGIDQDCDGQDLTDTDTDTDVDTDTDTGTEPIIAGRYQGGCACESGGASGAWSALALVALIGLRRKKGRTLRS